MKRMVNEELIKLLKNLGLSVSADENGNVTIGKNLEVDGYINSGFVGINDIDSFGVSYVNDTNGAYIFGSQDGDELSTVLTGLLVQDGGEVWLCRDAQYDTYQNNGFVSGDYISLGTLISSAKVYRHHLTLNGVACADFYSTQNLVCDSLQDLSTLTHDGAFAVNGDYTESKKASGVWQLVKADGTAVNVTSVKDEVTPRD